MPSAKEMFWRHDAEPFRSTMKQCLSDEPESSRFRDYKYSPSQGRNVLMNYKTDPLESNSRDYNDSFLHRLKPYPAREVEQTQAMRGEHYIENGRDRNTFIHASSPLSQVGSSVMDFQDESSRLGSLNSGCCIRVNDSDRVDDRRPDYSGIVVHLRFYRLDILMIMLVETHQGINKGNLFEILDILVILIVIHQL